MIENYSAYSILWVQFSYQLINSCKSNLHLNCKGSSAEDLLSGSCWVQSVTKALLVRIQYFLCSFQVSVRYSPLGGWLCCVKGHDTHGETDLTGGCGYLLFSGWSLSLIPMFGSIS